MTILVATPRHLFNPPVTGSHASGGKVITSGIGFASLQPDFNLSELEARAIADPAGYGDRIRSAPLRILIEEGRTALKCLGESRDGEQLCLLQRTWGLRQILPGLPDGRLSPPSLSAVKLGCGMSHLARPLVLHMLFVQFVCPSASGWASQTRLTSASRCSRLARTRLHGDAPSSFPYIYSIEFEG